MRTTHFVIAVALAIPAAAQTLVGTITRPGLQPRHVAVYETGNRVFISDQNSGNVYTFDGVTHAEINSAAVGKFVRDMVVHEGSGKLYVAQAETNRIAVINASTGALIGNLPGTYSSSTELVVDETGGRVWAHAEIEGLTRIEVATDAETDVPGIPGATFRGLAVNPVTHEVFVGIYGGDLYVVNGATLAVATFAGEGGAGGCVNWVENKGIVSNASSGEGFPSYVIYDRVAGTFTELLDVNDATEFVFDETRNVAITDSEVNSVSTFIRGDDSWFNFPIESSSTGVGVVDATGHVYYSGTDHVTMLDQESEVAVRLPVSGGPTFGVVHVDLAINQTTGRVYAVHDETVPTITVVQDTGTIERPPLFVGSSNVVADIHTVDPVTVEAVHTHESTPGFVSVRPGGGRVYVPGNAPGFVGKIEVLAGTGDRTRIDTFEPVGDQLDSVVVSPDGERLYVTSRPFSGNGRVIVLDAESGAEITSITVGLTPLGLAVTPDDAKIIVANNQSDSVSIISTATNSVIGSPAVGDGPQMVAVHPAGHKAYVSNTSAGTMSVLDLDSGTVIDTIPVGTTPSWLAFTADGTNLYVSNGGSGNVSIIDSGTDEVIDTVPMPGGSGTPRGIAANPDTTLMYVVGSMPSSASNIVTIDAGTHATNTYPLPSNSQAAHAIAATDVTARFGGRVSSSAGGVIAGATVRALQADVEKGTATTNALGDYVMPNLRPGTYDLEFANSGFATLTTTGHVGIRGNVTLEDATLAVCLATLTPPSTTSGSNGKSGTVTVTMPSGCAWTAVANDAFLSVTTGGSGNGNGSFGYTVAANPTGTQRVGTISAGGATFTVTQSGAPCVYDVTPHFANYGSAATSGSISVSVIPGCAWTAQATGFVSITSGASGNGSGTVTYDVAQNPGPQARSATMTVAGVTVTITQSSGATIALDAEADAANVQLSWSAFGGATSYQVWRSTGGAFAQIATTAATVLNDTSANPGTAYLYRIHAIGAAGLLAMSNVDLAVVFSFTDALHAGITPVRATHITQLRQAVSAAAVAINRPAPSFTDASLNGIPIRRNHLIELRTAVDRLRATHGLPAAVYTDPAITAGVTAVKAVHVTQLRDLLK